MSICTVASSSFPRQAPAHRREAHDQIHHFATRVKLDERLHRALVRGLVVVGAPLVAEKFQARHVHGRLTLELPQGAVLKLRGGLGRREPLELGPQKIARGLVAWLARAQNLGLPQRLRHARVLGAHRTVGVRLVLESLPHEQRLAHRATQRLHVPAHAVQGAHAHVHGVRRAAKIRA